MTTLGANVFESCGVYKSGRVLVRKLPILRRNETFLWVRPNYTTERLLVSELVEKGWASPYHDYTTRAIDSRGRVVKILTLIGAGFYFATPADAQRFEERWKERKRKRSRRKVADPAAPAMGSQVPRPPQA